MSLINTVNGPLSADDLGFTLMHEHVMISASDCMTTTRTSLGPTRKTAPSPA